MLRLFKLLTVVFILSSSAVCIASQGKPAGASFYKVKVSLWGAGVNGDIASEIPNINALDASFGSEASSSESKTEIPEELDRALFKLHAL